MTYDHTDADVPMMRRAKGIPDAIGAFDGAGDFVVFGAIGFDDNGDAFARTYPPQGMRCS